MEAEAKDEEEEGDVEQQEIFLIKCEGWQLCWLQLTAVLNLRYVTKWRAMGVTLVELLSPFCILGFLVIGYSLSDVERYSSQEYARVNLTIPGELMPNYMLSATEVTAARVKDGKGLLSLDDMTVLLDMLKMQGSGPLPVPTLDEFVGVGNELSSHIDAGAYDYLVSNNAAGKAYGNLMTLGTLHLVPDAHPVVPAFQKWLNETFPRAMDLLPEVRTHLSEQEAVDFVLTNLDERAWAVIVFDTVNDTHVDYTLRLNFSTLPSTLMIVDDVSAGLDTHFQRYYLSGFLTLQSTLDQFLLDDYSEGSCGPMYRRIVGIPFPTAAYDQNDFFLAVGFLLGLCLVMSILYPVSRLCKCVVEEKENHMKSFLLIMGLKQWVYEVSWFLTACAVFFWLTVGITILSSSTFLPSSDPTLLFVMFGSFNFSAINFALLLAAFFWRAKLAAVAAPMALFVAILPRYIFYGESNRYDGAAGKYFASLLSPTAFALGADIVADYEYQKMGATWSNWGSGNGFNLRSAILMCIFDGIAYGFLAWFQERDLLGSLLRKVGSSHRYERLSDREFLVEEIVGAPTVRLDALHKTFRGCKNPAVDSLSASLAYPGEITALVGRNGAGKSTLQALITGLLLPTRGDCIVLGKSVVKHLDEVRRVIGFCPQTNLLFELLTPSEHLDLICAIKGVEIRDRIRIQLSKLSEVGLLDKALCYSSSLSGGQKRKLCVAMAFTGGSKLVLCDEPTAGMDPHSRRAIWELLKKARRDCTIILTSHHTDEVELLSDRVAVLDHGQLLSWGSASFLKSSYGIGYTLVLNSHAGSNGMSELIDRVQSIIPMAQVVSQAGGELVLRVAAAASSFLPHLLDLLENDCRVSVGISVTSLEEVTMSLQEQNIFRPERVHESPVQNAGEGIEMVDMKSNLFDQGADGEVEYGGESERLGMLQPVQQHSARPKVLLCNQFAILLWKRWVVFRRDKKGIFFQVFLPVVLVALILLILTIDPPIAGPELILDSQQYGTPTEVLYAGHSPGLEWMEGKPLVNWVEMDGKVSTTSSLSRYMLQTYNDHTRHPRYGAYVFGDHLDMELNVDWSWVKNNSDALIDIAGSTYGPSLTVGPMDFDLSTLMQIPMDAMGPQLLHEVLADFTGDAKGAAMLDALLQRNRTGEAASIDGASINFQDKSVQVYGLQFVNESGGGTLVGNVTFDFNRASAFLPDGLHEYHSTADGPAVAILHNSTSYHALPTYASLLMGGIFRDCTKNAAASWKTRVHPLPLTEKQSIEVATVLSLLCSIFILIPLCYAPASLTTWVVKERAAQSLHSQISAGAQPVAYWVSAYVWDLGTYFILVFFLMLALLIYGQSASRVFLEFGDSALALFLLLVAYGGAAIPLCYCYTWGFVDHGTAQISIMSVQVLTGFGFVIGYYILNALETTKGIAGILVHVFRLFPPYDLGEGLINISASYYRRTILFDDVDIFQWDIAGRSLTYLSMQSVAYLLAVLCMESAFSGGRLGKSLDFVRLRCSSWQRRQTLAGIITEGQAAEDDDVLSERLKLAGVASMNEIAESAIFIRRLCKVYPPPAMNPAQGAKVAIKCVDFALNKGDCLGLLGANGAGKSTLQNIIMGTTNASAGEVLVYGHPLEKGSGLVGFCPQVDPLIDFMTVRETLSLYGYLKGVGKGSELINEVTAVLSKVALLEFANILATNLSGGNKRKLSLAMALIGNPCVLILDEPTTGMDFVARRALWRIISSEKGERSLILTTHHLDEAEAVCSRVAFMERGRFRCLSSIKRLKQKYGDNYSVSIRCAPDKQQNVMDFITAISCGVGQTVEMHSTASKFIIPRGIVSLRQIFEAISNCGLPIWDFRVSHGTLEDIFLQKMGIRR